MHFLAATGRTEEVGFYFQTEIKSMLHNIYRTNKQLLDPHFLNDMFTQDGPFEK